MIPKLHIFKFEVAVTVWWQYNRYFGSPGVSLDKIYIIGISHANTLIFCVVLWKVHSSLVAFIRFLSLYVRRLSLQQRPGLDSSFQVLLHVFKSPHKCLIKENNCFSSIWRGDALHQIGLLAYFQYSDALIDNHFSIQTHKTLQPEAFLSDSSCLPRDPLPV